jgi:hypothetical protein
MYTLTGQGFSRSGGAAFENGLQLQGRRSADAGQLARLPVLAQRHPPHWQTAPGIIAEDGSPPAGT